MIIGIEAQRANIANPTGVEHYAQQMILGLAKQDTENTYVLYLQTEPAQWIKDLPNNFRTRVIPFPIFWTQIRISIELMLHPADALFIMASALPLIHPKNSTVTIHDLAWQFYPETFSKFMRFYLPASTWFAVKFAKNIIAVSQQTKKDLVSKYKVNPDKITVIYHGFDISTERTFSSEQEKQKISKLPQKFILYLGTLQPRKNITGLIDAFIELKKEKSIEHVLVLVGGKGWLYEEIMRKIADHPEIIYLGYIQDRFAVLKKASLLVQPAFYEGFGMQILDAFAMEVPVASSNISSLPEVAGDAAVYFDPKSREQIKDAIYKVISNPDLASELCSKGSERLKLFTWQECVNKTLNVIKG